MGFSANASILKAANAKMINAQRTPDSLHELALKYTRESETISKQKANLEAQEPRDPSAKIQWLAALQNLDDQFDRLQAKATEVDSLYAGRILRESYTFVETGLVGRAYVYGAFLMPLPGSKYMDVTTNKIVRR